MEEYNEYFTNKYKCSLFNIVSPLSYKGEGHAQAHIDFKRSKILLFPDR